MLADPLGRYDPRPMSDFPKVVDAAWLAQHLGEPDLQIADVRGPNAHGRGHIPGSIPLVLGSPPPYTDEEELLELAGEIALRLRRQGISGENRLVLYDDGGCVGATAAQTMAELAGHPRVAVLLEGIGAFQGELASGTVYPPKVKEELTPNIRAIATRAELASRLADDSLTLIDVRRSEEFTGKAGAPCDPRQGHIPKARHLEVDRLFDGPGRPVSPELIVKLTGLPPDAEIVCYCHSGARSALAVLALRAAGYNVRNYTGSWHEWSRHSDLPLER